MPIEGLTAGFPVCMKDIGDGGRGGPHRLMMISRTDDLPGVPAKLKG